MHIGLHSGSLSHLSLADCLRFAHKHQFSRIEFAVGVSASAPHFDLLRLLASKQRRQTLLSLLDVHGIAISALNCPGNPLQPGESGLTQLALLRHTITLAALLGVPAVTSAAGRPYAITNAIVSEPEARLWSARLAPMTSAQWDGIVVPTWRTLAQFAADHGVSLCLSLDATSCLDRPDSLRRLREQAGSAILADLDLIDPDARIAQERFNALSGCIGHVHMRVDQSAPRPPATSLRANLETLAGSGIGVSLRPELPAHLGHAMMAESGLKRASTVLRRNIAIVKGVAA